MIKHAIQWLSPAGRSARLSIFIFHRVHAQPDTMFPTEPDARSFGNILGWIASWFQVIPLEQAVQALRAGTLPARAACITFDDGYADNCDVALPILLRHQLHATFFVASGFLDGGRMWNDTIIEAVRRTSRPELDLRGVVDVNGGRFPTGDVNSRRATLHTLIGHLKYLEPVRRLELVGQLAARAETELPSDLMMTTAQLRTLRSSGMGVGAHTIHHPILKSITTQQAMDEIDGGRRALESLLGGRIGLFAYPNGRPDVDYAVQVHPAMVKELGFDGAVSTHWGAARHGSDPYQLPRFTPWDRSRGKFGLRLVRNLLGS